MEKNDYYNGDILEIKEMIDTFNQYKETTPEIAELVEKHGELAEAFGRFAVHRGYSEDVIPSFITEFVDLTKDWAKHYNTQESSPTAPEEPIEN